MVEGSNGVFHPAFDDKRQLAGHFGKLCVEFLVAEIAEVAFVGKAYGAYNMYLGGGYHGQRLNKLYRSSIKEDEILSIMKPLLKRYAVERNDGERFGDFCIRIGMIKPTTEGKTFHDDVSDPAFLDDNTVLTTIL